MAVRQARGFGQYGGAARALERVGERWALLVVRDLLAGPRRYTDLKAGLPRIPTNILSDRLKELQEAGVVRRVPIARCGLVYELTDAGRDLAPVVAALERWGWSQLGDAGDDEAVTRDGLASALRAAFRADASEPTPVRTVLRVGEVEVAVTTSGDDLDVVPIGDDALPQPLRPDAPEIETTLELDLDPSGLRALLAGEADAPGIRVRSGDHGALAAFVDRFRMPPATSPERVSR
ncbi:winged helix-turn-helix transcriptional regulator [Agromyces mangrovi Wang et al. 2018]|uniref:winged helix-turn-helix transcriptional regulator n=1 Tax=Agromyces mangrovi TaxID=1858653 RepID=UPI002573305C|nr:helix-turn-helix domain-containing protein [Agromyces mangrovi]BDZ65152.1 HxlR family transcriptional regulator [Agromyces mangrovi]